MEETECVGDTLGQLKLSLNELELEIERIFSQPTAETKKDSPPPLTTEKIESPSIDPFLELERRMKSLSTFQQVKGNVSNEETSTENYFGSPTKRNHTGKKTDAVKVSRSDKSSGKVAEDEEESSPKKRPKKVASEVEIFGL